ncbi:TPA: hypothetical protein ACYK27_003058, partial [Enterococcus faecium]
PYLIVDLKLCNRTPDNKTDRIEGWYFTPPIVNRQFSLVKFSMGITYENSSTLVIIVNPVGRNN